MSLIELLDAFAAGVYLLFGLIHLDLWRKRRDRSSHLWLAVASGGALMVDLTGMRLRNIPAGSGGVLLPFFNLCGVALVTVSLFELVLSLGRSRSGRVLRSVYALLFALAAIIAVARLMQLVGPFLLLSGVVLLTSMVHAARAGYAGDREARTITAGLVVLIVTLIVDILMNTGALPMVPGIPIIGFITLFLVSAGALNTRYEREHRELVTLQRELEERVADRTQELEEANKRLAEASRTDSLTGLPNRRGFLEVSDHEVKRSLRAGAPLSVIMVDLDHFKDINDRHGHAAGDDLLKAAATKLRTVMRAEDVVARWGGEEFIILLPDTNAASAALAAEKARAAFAASPFAFDDKLETITASFGVAQHRGDRALEATIEEADQALYRAKDGGRDRVEVAAIAVHPRT